MSHSITDATAVKRNGIVIRSMVRDQKDCEAVAELTVEAKEREYIHATSRGSLPTIQHALERDYAKQDDWFFRRTFMAEIDGAAVGLLSLRFPEDPVIQQGDYAMEFGCTDGCGLSCLNSSTDVQIKEGEVNINLLYVRYWNQHANMEILQELLNTAEREALKEDREVHAIITDLPFGSHHKHIYIQNGYQQINKKCCCVWCSSGNCGYTRLEKQLR